MLQIVHDLAPGAPLAFATAATGETSFANDIRALLAAGSKVIVDDVSYFDEPFFQDGPVSVAVNDVVAGGADYFSSAANNNLISGGRDVASYEAPAFRNSGSCPSGVPSYATQCMDFNPTATKDNSYGITVQPGGTALIDLQWAQPWNGVTTDLDAYLVSQGGTLLAESENFNVDTTQKPFELVGWKNSTGVAQNINLAINRCDSVCGDGGGDKKSPRLKFIFVQNGDTRALPTEYLSSNSTDVVGPAIFGHNGAENAVSVAAVPFDDSTTAEQYSSRGPEALYFGPVSGSSPASPLSSPRVLSKPDVAATDCGVTTFFASFDGSNWRFCGTSAAAPHAAAIAALQLEADPSATFAQVRNAQQSTADPIGSFGPFDVGGGLLNALNATQALESSNAPSNDDFASAKVLRGSSAARGADTNVQATKESGEPDHAQNPGGASVWYRWQAPKSGRVTLDTAGSDFDTLLGVYTGNVVSGLSEVVANDDLRSSDPTSRVRFNATAGVTYEIAVDGHNDESGPAEGSIQLHLTEVSSKPQRRPNTTITSGPSGRTHGRSPRFRFTSSEHGSSFKCRLDRRGWHTCSSPKRYHHLARRRHLFEVAARNNGGTDSSPAHRRFRVVKRKHHHRHR